MSHDHDLDGTLHDDCPMCDEIRRRQPGAQRDRRRDEALERHQAKAARTTRTPETDLPL